MRWSNFSESWQEQWRISDQEGNVQTTPTSDERPGGHDRVQYNVLPLKRQANNQIGYITNNNNETYEISRPSENSEPSGKGAEKV